MRRGVLATLLSLLLSAAAMAAKPEPQAWADWQAFQQGFIEEGRVIDRSAGGRTVSEGQSYALFFALVANDRAQFDKILTWTQNNLAGGDLAGQLPAWQWGKRSDGAWGVIDTNAATDADLWIAYSLLEAGRLWRVSAYGKLGRSLLKLVERQSIARISGGPTLLLPGPQGFALDNGAYRINPSYYVPSQLLRFAAERPRGPWSRLLTDYVSIVEKQAPAGGLPDWMTWEGDHWGPDRLHGAVGSYDAIRCYLWAGMSVGRNGQAERLRVLLSPFLSVADRRNNHLFPERWTVGYSDLRGDAPIGFYAALLPLAATNADRQQKITNQLDQLLKADHEASPAKSPDYYNQVLLLFGKGYVEGRYRFDSNGRLLPSWH